MTGGGEHATRIDRPTCRLRAPLRATLILWTGLACAALACTPATKQPAPNLVLVVVDTLRADHLGAWGHVRDTSPHLDALAREGVRFERAYATAPWTKPSVASILTGLAPSAHGVERMAARLPDEGDTLAEMLGRAGYARGATVSHTLITGLYNFAQGFELFVAKDARGHDHVSSPSVTESALAMVDRLRAQDRPFFLFVHYFDPHYAYKRHPEYGFTPERAGRLSGGESLAAMRRLDPPLNAAETRFLRDAYDEEIRFTDAAIGALLDGLAQRGLDEDTVVAVTADHGEEFYEHAWLGHARTLYEEVLHVPLVLRLARGEAAGTVVGEPVSLVDLAPTLIDALGFDASDLDLPGRSLLPLVRGEALAAPVPVFAEVDYMAERDSALFPTRRSGYMRALIVGHEKLIHDRHTDTYELYDLAADPRERNDLAALRPERVAALRTLLEAEAQAAAAGRLGATAPHEADPQEREMLEALGYVEESEP